MIKRKTRVFSQVLISNSEMYLKNNKTLEMESFSKVFFNCYISVMHVKKVTGNLTFNWHCVTEYFSIISFLIVCAECSLSWVLLSMGLLGNARCLSYERRLQYPVPCFIVLKLKTVVALQLVGFWVWILKELKGFWHRRGKDLIYLSEA